MAGTWKMQSTARLYLAGRCDEDDSDPSVHHLNITLAIHEETQAEASSGQLLAACSAGQSSRTTRESIGVAMNVLTLLTMTGRDTEMSGCS